MSATALVCDIVRFSSVDGPGNRCVVFLQGCNFDCIACHNPYTINVCNNCGECVGVCESGALSLTAAGDVLWDPAACVGSDSCVGWCPHDSTPKARHMSVPQVLDQIRGPAPFLSGITLSGGEATQQPVFVGELFEAMKSDHKLNRLTRFIDSNGAAPQSVWLDLEPVVDGVMVDLKALDPDTHLAMTGHSNEEVLASIKLLYSMGKLAEVRLLLLPGVNDSPDALARTGAWLHDIDPLMRLKLIGFRCHGVRHNGRVISEPNPEAMTGYAQIMRDAGMSRIISI